MGAVPSPDGLGNGRTLTSGNENSNHGCGACRGSFCLCILYDVVAGSMKVGDLVKMRQAHSPNVGIIISIKNSSTGEWAKIKWSETFQSIENWRDLEVVNEAG